MSRSAILFFTFIFGSLVFVATQFRYVGPADSLPEAAESVCETGSLDQSSLFAAKNKCVALLTPNEKEFRLDRLQEFVARLEKNGGPTPEFVQESMSSPEQLLAVLEFTSRQQAYEGLKFSELIESLSAKERDALKATLSAKTKSGELTEMKMMKLLTTVYRITHKPRGFWKTAWNTKNLSEAFDRVGEQTLVQRIELELVKRGLGETFKTVIVDPTHYEKFKSAMSARRYWIEPALTLALWTAGLFSGHATTAPVIAGAAAIRSVVKLMPPFLPSFERFTSVHLTPQILDKILENGLEEGMKELMPVLRVDVRKELAWKYVRSKYALIFTVLLSVSILDRQVGQVLHDRQVEAQNRMDATMALAEDLNTMDKMTAEELGTRDFERFIAFAKANGTNLDPNSPEMQAEKQLRINHYVVSIELKKGNR
ncbi:MAG: hypothetical protein ABL958_03280 [Bdellovibrionia bacterium]